jgi:hypothetical protein
LDRLIKTSHRLQEEIAEALGESVRHTGDKPSSATGHTPPRKSPKKKGV